MNISRAPRADVCNAWCVSGRTNPSHIKPFNTESRFFFWCTLQPRPWGNQKGISAGGHAVSSRQRPNVFQTVAKQPSVFPTWSKPVRCGWKFPCFLVEPGWAMLSHHEWCSAVDWLVKLRQTTRFQMLCWLNPPPMAVFVIVQAATRPSFKSFMKHMTIGKGWDQAGVFRCFCKEKLDWNDWNGI